MKINDGDDTAEDRIFSKNCRLLIPDESVRGSKIKLIEYCQKTIDGQRFMRFIKIKEDHTKKRPRGPYSLVFIFTNDIKVTDVIEAKSDTYVLKNTNPTSPFDVEFIKNSDHQISKIRIKYRKLVNN